MAIRTARCRSGRCLELRAELTGEEVDGGRLERSGLADLDDEGLRPGDQCVVHVDRLREQSPFGVREAQGGSDGDLSESDPLDDLSYRGDLPTEPLDEFGLVPTVDVQADIGAAPPSDVAPLHLAGVVLRIDDPDAVRCDDEMVDVALGPRNTPVVEHDGDITQLRSQLTSEAFFSVGSLGVCCGGLWLVGDTLREAADPAGFPLLLDLSFGLRGAALVLLARRDTGGTGLDRGWWGKWCAHGKGGSSGRGRDWGGPSDGRVDRGRPARDAVDLPFGCHPPGSDSGADRSGAGCARVVAFEGHEFRSHGSPSARRSDGLTTGLLRSATVRPVVYNGSHEQVARRRDLSGMWWSGDANPVGVPVRG